MMHLRNKRAFTLVEILVVVAIVAILATISAPMLMQHRHRAVASEAVAIMALIRQAQRDYHINTNNYFDVDSPYISGDLPTSVSSGIPSPSTAGVDVDAAVSQYFSNHAYSVDATSPSSGRFTNPSVVDFLITVNGSNSVACSSSVSSNCAINASKAASYRLEMDNSGRIFFSQDSGAHWSAF